MKGENDPSPVAVLIAAPSGQDAKQAAQLLSQAGIVSRIFSGISEAAAQTNDSTLALLLAEEALKETEMPALLAALRAQPPWSDIPVIVLTAPGATERMSEKAVDLFGPAGNVTLLDRPLQGVTLVSAAKVASRARQRQFEVRDLLEQREMVLSGISDAFTSLDRDWRYIYVNDRVAELAGMPKEKMIGQKIWDIFPTVIGSEFYKLAHIAMNERRAVQSESFYQLWGRWFDTRIYPTKGGIVIFRADISERKKQELKAREQSQKLQESEALLRLATEAADIGTFDYYPKSGEVRWSDRCKALWGLPQDAEINYEIYLSGLHPDDRHIVHETVQAVLKPGGTGRYDIEYRTVGIRDRRERWISEKGRAVFDENGNATRFIGTMIDITASKIVELTLQRAKGEAEDANRAKDRFLAMLSHELRTPLTPVLMTITSMQRDQDLSDEVRDDLELLQRNVELEALLIDDLLDVTRIVHGKLELHNDAVDLHGILEHALTITSPEIKEKKLTVIRKFEAREHHCWADGARLQQVFWNLVKNAVKFTPAQGRISLSTRNDSAHKIIVEVTDSGIGIEPGVLPKIFDAFEQGGRAVTSQFGGLGLGLAISKRVVDLHGGNILVSSAGREQGATFTVTLQAMETSLLEGPAHFFDRPRTDFIPANILLVEDHEDTALALLRVLKKAGYKVSRTNTIAAARAIVEKESFDLLISDLGLPDGNGLDLMRALREKNTMPAIALSGFGMEEDLRASKAAGFAEHLTKPVDWELLESAILRLTNGRIQSS